MDPEIRELDSPEGGGKLIPVLIAVLIALVVGILIGRFAWPTGDDLEILEGKLGVVSVDLDAVGLQDSGQSFDLSHATNADCLEQLERGETIFLGIASVDTGDEETPSEAFLNSPQAEIVLWVECPGVD